LDVLSSLCIPGIVYRANGSNSISDYSLAVWAQKARIEASKVKVSSINIALLKKSIQDIRALTVLDPSDFCSKLIDILAKCGVAVVFLPHIGGSFLHGASFIDRKHIVLGLTVRGKDADKFWFSLFHEIHHITEGHISMIDRTTNKEEKEADMFACNTLIPYEDYIRFLNQNDYSKEAIVAFAESINIASGIVVGRLQKDNVIPFNRYNELKVKYMIKD